MKKNISSAVYAKSGVNYSKLDKLKVSAQQSAHTTAKNILDTDYREVAESRGESAYLIEHQNHYLAMVQEGLGTKSLVADSVRSYTHKTFYDNVGIDTVAMIVNDLITVGARPLVVQQYLATGDEAWLDDAQRFADLARGWQWACDQVGATWGGGETPGLKGIIQPGTVDLAGSAIGIIEPKGRLMAGHKIQDGDVMIGFASSGIHANGLSLARQLASTLSKGYQTKINETQTFGEALLVPTVLYGSLIQSILNANIELHYCVNITGHGWRKLMRANESFAYTITTIPPVPRVLEFICDQKKLSPKDAYATFNMGVGMCVYAAQKDATHIIELARKQKIASWEVGVITKSAHKKVSIKPLEIEYQPEELQIR